MRSGEVASVTTAKWPGENASHWPAQAVHLTRNIDGETGFELCVSLFVSFHCPYVERPPVSPAETPPTATSSASASTANSNSVVGTARVKRGMAEMLKGGVIMD